MFRQTPTTMGFGCATALVNLRGFVAGVYLGLSESQGNYISPELHGTLKYGAMGLNGLIGLIGGTAIVNDSDSLDSIIENMPSPPPNMEVDNPEGCTKGCFGCGFPVMGALSGAGFTYLGYFIGGLFGKSSS
ncbi:MAG: hypothetical protein ABIF88_01070 [archaeon]